jgi:hypothetical protein
MTLDKDDVEAVAERVVELLEEVTEPAVAPRDGSPRLVDAATLARVLGISRATVYAKADEFGAIRVGNGKRARLRFDPARAVATAASDDAGDSSLAARHRPPRRKSPEGASQDLLPIRGGRTRSAGPLRS